MIRKDHIENALLGIFAFPILGLMLGGIYSIPAMKITRERDPWLTLALILGLSVTVFGVGSLLRTPIMWIVILWLGGIVLLLAARQLHGSLGHNLERFGIVHAPVLFISFILGTIEINHQNAEQDVPPKSDRAGG